MSALVEADDDYNPRKIFVGNLPFTVKSEDLSGLFASYGRIIGVNIREDRLTGKPKGFAFVTFDSEEAATAAITTMNNYNFCGRNLTVKRANLRGSDAKADNPSNAWKSVPIPSPLERQKADKKNTTSKTGSVGTGNNNKSSKTKPKSARPTWDTWVGPSTSTAPPTQPTAAANKPKTAAIVKASGADV